MTQEEYIKTHPEQFQDEIDKWLFTEFGIIGGCCSAEKSHEYAIARMVAEKLTDAFIEKACEWLENHNDYQRVHDNGRGVRFDMTLCVIDFRKAMKGE